MRIFQVRFEIDDADGLFVHQDMLENFKAVRLKPYHVKSDPRDSRTHRAAAAIVGNGVAIRRINDRGDDLSLRSEAGQQFSSSLVVAESQRCRSVCAIHHSESGEIVLRIIAELELD